MKFLKIALALLWGSRAALAQTFPAGPHVDIKVLPEGKFLICLKGKAWPKKQQPSLSNLQLNQASYGCGQIVVERLTDMADLRLAPLTGRCTTGITSSRTEKRSLAWLTESKEGGCLVLEDIKAAQWANDSNLTLSAAKTPILACIWLGQSEVKELTKVIYKAMGARTKKH